MKLGCHLQVAPGDPILPDVDTTFHQQNPIHRTLCPQTASLSIADTISPASGLRLTKIMCVLSPAAFGMGPKPPSLGGKPKKRPEGLLARLSMGAAAIAGGSPVKALGSPRKFGSQDTPRKSISAKATSLKVSMQACLLVITRQLYLTCRSYLHLALVTQTKYFAAMPIKVPV